MKHGDKIKLKILDVGLKTWPNVSARYIGRTLGITHSAVLYHFGDADKLNYAIRRHAVEKGVSAIIVQLIAQADETVEKMPLIERQRHLKAVG